MRLNRSYRIQAIKFQPLRSPEEEYMIQTAHKTTGAGTLISLALEFPAKEGLARPGRENCPFWWVKGTHRTFPGLTQEPAPCPGRAAPCGWQRGTSQVTKGLHSPRGYQVKAEITHHIFLFPFLPLEAHHEVFLGCLTVTEEGTAENCCKIILVSRMIHRMDTTKASRGILSN